jgi:hypothetical protein
MDEQPQRGAICVGNMLIMKTQAPEGRNLAGFRLRPSGAWFAGSSRFYTDCAPPGLSVHNSRYLISR